MPPCICTVLERSLIQEEDYNCHLVACQIETVMMAVGSPGGENGCGSWQPGKSCPVRFMEFVYNCLILYYKAGCSIPYCGTFSARRIKSPVDGGEKWLQFKYKGLMFPDSYFCATLSLASYLTEKSFSFSVAGRLCLEIIKWVFAISGANTVKNKPKPLVNRPLGYLKTRKLQV